MSEVYHIAERDETIQNTMFRQIQKKYWLKLLLMRSHHSHIMQESIFPNTQTANLISLCNRLHLKKKNLI